MIIMIGVNMPDAVNVFTDSFEFKSEGGNYYVEGILEVANYIDTANDTVTQACINDMVTQVKDTSVTAKFSLKGNEDHEQVKSGDRRIIPRARIIDAEVKSDKIHIKVLMNKHHTEFKSLWGSIQDKFIDAFSMEFKPVEYKSVNVNGRTVRVLNKVDLGGVAFTGKPICEECKITDFFIKSKEVDNMADEDNKDTDAGDKPEDVPTGAEPDTPETPEGVTEEIKSEIAKLKADIETRDKEITELKSKIGTTQEIETVSKDEIKSLISEAVKAIKPAKPEVDTDQKKFETKSMEGKGFVDMIVASKVGSE